MTAPMPTDGVKRGLGAALAVALLAMGGCSLLFPFAPGEGGADPSVRDAAADASPADAAADAGPCPDRPVEGRMHDDCLGCGTPCGPARPFCCGATCCAEECGSVVDNECSSRPEEPLGDGDADADVDADADGDADGCDHGTYEDCLGCGNPCSAKRPFCCGNICCSEECGTLVNDCSTSALR